IPNCNPVKVPSTPSPVRMLGIARKRRLDEKAGAKADSRKTSAASTVRRLDVLPEPSREENSIKWCLNWRKKGRFDATIKSAACLPPLAILRYCLVLHHEVSVCTRTGTPKKMAMPNVRKMKRSLKAWVATL